MRKNFWSELPKPIIALAPMDGYTDSAFRRVCRSQNPAVIVVTEFTSTDGFHFAREKVRQRFRFNDEEQPILAQIFGHDPANFVEAAKYCQEQGFSGIDINMGCPARHVVKSEQGVALRRCPDKAYEIVEAVARAVRLPVSVKTRLGLDDASDLLSFGKGLENAGANLLTIHGRTYADPYGCRANWEPIYELQRTVAIPVIGNGGVTSMRDGMNKMKNLAGFMIGQAALGNPWIFSPVQPKEFREKVPLILQHVDWMIGLKSFNRAPLEIRKHLIAYAKGLPNAASCRSRLARVSSLEEVKNILAELAGIPSCAAVQPAAPAIPS